MSGSSFDPSCESDYCPPSCENVFDMVHVSYLIKGGTRVMWELLPTFTDPQPWSFQLQVGETGLQDADDWEDVGVAVDNTCYAVDGTKRSYNKTQKTHYRVKLVTSVGTYYSAPTAKSGILSPRDWRLAQEIVRKERVRFKYSAQDGYILKRRTNGQDCTACLDYQTNEVTDPFCPQCWGTGKQCGYYYPMGCVWADLSPRTTNIQIDNNATRGTINDIVISGRMLMLPLISSNDVWVSRKTDERYYIRAVQHSAEIRGVPLLANVEMRPAPFTDVIYSIDIPQQDAWITSHV